MALDPQIKNFLDIFNKLPIPQDPSVAKGREDYLHFSLFHAGWPLKMARVEDIMVKGTTGHPIPLRLYTPQLHQKLPVFVYIHGGGWQRGDIATHDSICRHLATYGQCLVVSVEWRLAPEHPFPVGIGDCLDAYQWVLRTIESHNGNPQHIGLGGDSAGGNLTASVFQKIKERNIPQPQFQLLLYPSLDLMCTSSSYQEFSEGYFLSTEHVKKYVEDYLPSLDMRLDPLVSPLYQEDVRYLPRTHVVYAGFDPLRGDAERYVKKLKEAGVPVTSHCYEGMIHAFLHMNHSVPAVTQALKEIGAIVKDNLHKNT